MISTRSIFFLFSLLAVVLFVAGINVGKQIESVDKKASVRPSPTLISPTITSPPLEYKTFIHADCGITFLYPASLKEIPVSSTSGSLTGTNESIMITCDKKDISDFENQKETLKEEDTRTYKTIKVPLYSQNDRILFEIKNTLNGKTVVFNTSKNIVSLVLKTLEFSK